MPEHQLLAALELSLQSKLGASSSQYTCSGRVQVQLSLDCPHYGELSHSLNNGGAYPLELEGGQVVLVPVEHRYQYTPPAAISVLIMHLPLCFNVEEAPAAILEMAGYRVIIPEAGVNVVSRPPPDTVVLLRFRNFRGGPRGERVDPSGFQVTLLPPASDPHLRHLPPRFRFPDWDPDILTMLERDPLPKVPRAPANPAGRNLPSDLGPGWHNMPVDYAPPAAAPAAERAVAGHWPRRTAATSGAAGPSQEADQIGLPLLPVPFGPKGPAPFAPPAPPAPPPPPAPPVCPAPSPSPGALPAAPSPALAHGLPAAALPSSLSRNAPSVSIVPPPDARSGPAFLPAQHQGHQEAAAGSRSPRAASGVRPAPLPARQQQLLSSCPAAAAPEQPGPVAAGLKQPRAAAGAQPMPSPARQQQRPSSCPAAAAPEQPGPLAAGAAAQPPWRGPLLEARQRGPATAAGHGPPGPALAHAAGPLQPGSASSATRKPGARRAPPQPPAAVVAQPVEQRSPRGGRLVEPPLPEAPLTQPAAGRPAGQRLPASATPAVAASAAPASSAAPSPASPPGREGMPSWEGQESPIATPAPPQGPPRSRRRQPLDGTTAASRAARREKRQASLEMWGEDDHRDLSGDRRERSETGSDALPPRRRQRPVEWWRSPPRHPPQAAPSKPSVPPRGTPRRSPRKGGRILPPVQQPSHSCSRKSSPSRSGAAPSCRPAAGRAK